MIWPELHLDKTSETAVLLKLFFDDDDNNPYMMQSLDSINDGLDALLSNIAMMLDNYRDGFDMGYCVGYDEAIDNLEDGQLST